MVLRTVFDCNYQVNKDLGKEYHYIDSESCKEEFARCLKTHFGIYENSLATDCFGFIAYGVGKEVIPLYKGHQNLILSNDGQVFNDLTNK